MCPLDPEKGTLCHYDFLTWWVLKRALYAIVTGAFRDNCLLLLKKILMFLYSHGSHLGVGDRDQHMHNLRLKIVAGTVEYLTGAVL